MQQQVVGIVHRIGFDKDGTHLGRHGAQRITGFALGQRDANGRGGGKAFAGKGRIVIAAAALNGDWFHARIDFPHGADVLGGEDGVGRVEQRLVHAEVFCGGDAPGARVAHAGGQVFANHPDDAFRFRHADFRHAFGQVFRFASEGQRVDAEGVQDGHACTGKHIGGAHGEQRGQLEHRVRAARQRHARPIPFGQTRGGSALGIAARHADHDIIAARANARLLQMIGMTGVEWIVLGNDARDFQCAHLFVHFNQNPRFLQGLAGGWARFVE